MKTVVYSRARRRQLRAKLVLALSDNMEMEEGGRRKEERRNKDDSVHLLVYVLCPYPVFFFTLIWFASQIADSIVLRTRILSTDWEQQSPEGGCLHLVPPEEHRVYCKFY